MNFTLRTENRIWFTERGKDTLGNLSEFSSRDEKTEKLSDVPIVEWHGKEAVQPSNPDFAG